MADMLQAAMQVLADTLKANMAGAVTIKAGATEATGIQAVKGRTLLQVDDGAGSIRMVWTDRDYLIEAADLVVAGVASEPQRGWQILDPAGGKIEVFEVLAPAGEPVWRWSDPYRTVYRIHTKFVRTEFP